MWIFYKDLLTLSHLTTKVSELFQNILLVCVLQLPKWYLDHHRHCEV